VTQPTNMTLEAKDKLIRDLIKENRDSTIKDYLEIVKDLDSIEATDTVSVDQVIRKRYLALQNYVFRF
jgi:hypothetical protein